MKIVLYPVLTKQDYVLFFKIINKCNLFEYIESMENEKCNKALLRIISKIDLEKIKDIIYKTSNNFEGIEVISNIRKDFKVLKNLKDNYVVRDMKLVQSDNSFSSIKLNNKEVGIRYVIYQEENENKKNNIYYSYYLELYFNNSKLNRVMKILDTSDSFSKLGSIKLDNINFNKIVGLDHKEYLIINYNVLNNNYSLGRNYVYVLNDEFKIIYEVPFISGEELLLEETYNISFNNKLSISNDSIYYLNYKKDNKIDIHRVTFYDNRYYDEVIDTKKGSVKS